MSKLIRIAHRGASADWPENTLLAFRQALDAGADWLELDVQCSIDGALLVIHDETLERTTNGQGAVAEQSVAMLRQLDAGQGEQIPLLEELLDLAAGRAQVNIELKGPETARPVARLLRQRFARGRTQPEDFLVSSSLAEELSCFAEQGTGVRLAPIADTLDAEVFALAEKVAAWSIHLEQHLLSAAQVRRIQTAGYRLLVFTVNQASDLKRLQGLGVDGIFSDRVEIFTDPGGKNHVP